VGVDVGGIVMLPVALILKSDNDGEQEMVVSGAGERSAKVTEIPELLAVRFLQG
jgi:hypothetical protein